LQSHSILIRLFPDTSGRFGKPKSSSVFIAGDRTVSAEEVNAKLKSDGWSNIVISSDGKYLQVSGQLNEKANNIAIDSQTGRQARRRDDGDDD